MSRPLRIEYPGAWYHVMNHGRRSEAIFSCKKDYDVFINLLKETAELWNVKVTAYCLMSNHYHIILQIPEGNLSKGMRHLNVVYTQRYNKLHGYDGQLFRDRYKSILVETIDEYKWSSHKAYLSNKESYRGKFWEIWF